MDVGRISNHLRIGDRAWSVDLVGFSDVYCAVTWLAVGLVYSSDAFENVGAVTNDAP